MKQSLRKKGTTQEASEEGKTRSGRAVVSDSGESKGLAGEDSLEECGKSGMMGSLLANLPEESLGGRLVDLDIR
jgi:hypothetical protein